MKKLTPIFLIICGSFLSLQSHAQTSQEFNPGTLLLNPGIGYGINYGYGGTFFPSISVALDDGLKVNAGPGTIGIGGIIGFKFGSYGFYSNYTNVNYSNSYSETVIAVRGTYHWTPPGAANVDLYAGIPIGIRLDHYTEYNPYYDSYLGYYVPGETSGTVVYPFIGLFIGASYYFSNNVGVFAELGYDVSAFTVGLNFKLK